jgi:single-stranded-DNA-specific exonuclease
VPGVDLGRIVRAAVEAGLLIKGGGHAMAAGITLAPAQVPAFRTFLEASLDGVVPEEDALFIDAALTAAGADAGLLDELERAGPFGAGNPEPIFVMPAHRLIDVAPVGNGHIRLRAQAGDGARIDGIAFRAAEEPLGTALAALRGAPAHLAGYLALDRWGGRQRVQLRVIDVAPAGVSA